VNHLVERADLGIEHRADLRELAACLVSLAERGEKPGALFTPIRVATTGKRIAPPLFDTLETLGQAQTVARLNAAAERLARPDD